MSNSRKNGCVGLCPVWQGLPRHMQERETCLHISRERLGQITE